MSSPKGSRSSKRSTIAGDSIPFEELQKSQGELPKFPATVPPILEAELPAAPSAVSLSSVTCEDEKKKQVSAILRHVLLNNAVRDVTIQAELRAFQMMFEGDEQQRAAKAAMLIGKTVGVVGAFEFLLNPIVGRVSDTYGRRLFTMLGCSCACVGSLLMARNPSARVGPVPLVALNRLMCGSLLTISGSVTSSVAMSDVQSGGELAISLSSMNAMFGLGSIVGPYLGAQLFARTGSVQACFAARAVLAALHFLHNSLFLRETLDDKNRQPLKLKGLNPFGFLKLLGTKGPLLQLVLAQTLISMSEAKNLIDLKTMWLTRNLSYGIQKVNLEQTLYGVMMFGCGQYFAPKVLRTLGQRIFTDLALWSSALGFLFWEASQEKPMWLGLCLLFPGINAASATALKAASTGHAVSQGMGKGEFASYVANLRALTVVFAPLLWGKAYAHFTTRGDKGGHTWVLVSLITAVLPALLHRSIAEGKWLPPASRRATVM